MGALGVAVWVFYWDAYHETITSFFRRHPLVGVFVFSWVWSHIVLDKPKRILIRW